MDDKERADRLTALAEAVGDGGADGLAGMQSLQRELEAMEPGSCDRLRARLTQHRIAANLQAFARR